MIVLSHYQAKVLLSQRRTGSQHAEVSPDLELSTVQVELEGEGVRFPNGEFLFWDDIDEIDGAENSCFVLEAGQAQKILTFSERTNRVYSLMPTPGAPTMLISGILMHRIKGTDPYRDTLEKIKTLQPITGRVLDTATGLGYTAIEAAKTAEQVITIELDPTALEIARLNPWSRALFGHPRIVQRIGDSCDVVQEFDDGAFDRIIHDPPTFRLADQLYSRDFYEELHRLLRRGGRLFHYIGNPESKSGSNITRGVIRRLQEAGFGRVMRRPRAFGVVASR